jgi:hypothetical protein
VDRALQSEQGRLLHEAEDRMADMHVELVRQQHLYDDLKALRERTEKANYSLSSNIDKCHTTVRPPAAAAVLAA